MTFVPSQRGDRTRSILDSRRGRRWAACAAIGVAGLLATPGLALPASASALVAAGPCDNLPTGYAARASAELLKVGVLNLAPLGLKLPAVADVTVGASNSSMSGATAIRSSASAQYADARLLGLKLPGGPLDGRVYQQAPPTDQSPVRDNALSLNFGVVQAGTGDLSAHAQWADGMACGRQTGPAGESSAALLDARVLGSGNGALLSAPDNLASRSETGTLIRDGRPISAAGAQASLTRLKLLGGAITVKVISAPQLRVFATGSKSTSSVSYASPVLEISGAGIATQRLSGLDNTVEIAVPVNGLGALPLLTDNGARERAALENLPLLDGDPLRGLLGALPLGSLAGSAGKLTGPAGSPAAQPSVPELGKLPVLGPILGAAGLGGLTGGLGEIAVLRLAIGDLQQTISDSGVAAQAASLRVQLLALGRSDARGERATLLDVGVGLLSAAATAPKFTVTPSASSQPSSRPTPSAAISTSPVADQKDCAGADCTLPLTGTAGIGLIVGTGLALFAGGRLLYVLSRRRA